MNEVYLERLGRIICDTYTIKDQDHYRVGKLINATYKLLEEEMMRDLREAANQSQGNANDTK